jgi:hypothetical protein
MDLARDETIWREVCGDLVGGTLDRGGGRTADTVTRSRLIAGSHVKRLHRATIPAPTALSLSLLYSALHVGNIVMWIHLRRLMRLHNSFCYGLSETSGSL